VSQEKTEKRVERNHPARNPPSLRALFMGDGSVPIKGKRRGFLPFDTNPFDRVFVSLVLTVAIHLLWMRLLEAHIPLTVATILCLILSVFIFVRG
jgi:predicted small integral membrane protein